MNVDQWYQSFVDEPPYHVKECIRIATTDFTVAGIQNNELDFQEIKNEPDVQLDSNIEFEVDKPKEKPNNNEVLNNIIHSLIFDSLFRLQHF